MAFWNALSDVLRPRPMMHVTDATNSAVTTPYASKSTEALAGSAPPTVEASETRAPMTEEAPEPSKHEKNLMLHLSNVSHGVNHFQNQMMAMLYPSIMAELGMSYMQVGVMSAICSALNSVCQGAYGFVTPFVSRCKVLGFGNFGIALGTLLSGLAGSYPMLVMARAVASVGSSAQHPVGYSILASYFPKNRAAVMALNTSASNIGTLVATPLATAMLLVMGWRSIFWLGAAHAVVSLVCAVTLLPPSRAFGFQGRFDWLGCVLFAPAIAALLLAVEFW